MAVQFSSEARESMLRFKRPLTRTVCVQGRSRARISLDQSDLCGQQAMPNS